MVRGSNLVPLKLYVVNFTEIRYVTKAPDIRHIFDQILKDFESDPNPREVLVPFKGVKGTYTVREYRISQEPKYRVTDAYLIFIIFVQLTDFKFKGRDEKVAWTIPIKYKEEPFLLTYRKFGFQVIGKKRAKNITILGREAMYKIYKALPYAEKLIQPIIREKVQNGNLNLENHFGEILSHYRFFKRKAAEEFKKSEKPRYQTMRHNKKMGPVVLVSNFKDLSAGNTIAGNNYGIAMLDAYFSLLEHILVLMLPFVRGIDHDKIDVEEFILKNWKDKIRFIVPLSDVSVGEYFQSLLAIKETLRNPLTHGHFQRGGHSIFVHMKWIGAIPMNLSKRDRHFDYSWNTIYQGNFNNILETFEGFLEFLSTNDSTLYGMKYLKSGLNVGFDKASRARYGYAMKDKITFDKFIERELMDYTNALNMDW